MTTAIALDLNPLRSKVIGLLSADEPRLKDAFDRLRVEDPDYCGPDPQPHIAAITQRLNDRDIEVRHDNRVFDKIGCESDMWGLTVPPGVSSDFPRPTIVLRENMPPRGMLLTLAHEGAHALTVTKPGILDVIVALITHKIAGGDPEKEVGAEMVAYLVGAATGVMPDPNLSADYIIGWLGGAERIGLDAAGVWARQSIGARHSAAILLGASS